MRDTIGHVQTWQRLAGAFDRGQVHHAYLLAGPESIGKTTLALDFAQLLVCEARAASTEKPCGVCTTCLRIAHGNYLDVAIVEPEEGKRLLGVEAVRGTVVRMANQAPSAGAWRVFIVPRVERMTPSTVNALLKTLEEPPPGVVIVLTTSEPESLLPTVLSRCQLLTMQPLSTEQVAAALRERWHAAGGRGAAAGVAGAGSARLGGACAGKAGAARDTDGDARPAGGADGGDARSTTAAGRLACARR